MDFSNNQAKLIDVSRYTPFKDGGREVPLPSCFNRRYGIINPPVKTNKCFQNCVAAYYLKLCSRKQGNILKNYDPFFRELNRNNIAVNLKNAKKMEWISEIFKNLKG